MDDSIVSLLYDVPHVELCTACSEVRGFSRRSYAIGRLGFLLNYSTNFLDDEQNYFLKLMDSYSIGSSICIDSRFLMNHKVMDILRNSTTLKEIRIVDEGYRLSNSDLELLPQNVRVICDEADNDVDLSRVFLQHGSFKKGIDYVDDDIVSSYCVDHELNDEEMNYLISKINADYSDYRQISFRVYNPSLYKSFLQKLHDRGLNEDVKINFLGNPLYDKSDLYGGLNDICNNQISITYNTCSDMVNFYMREPFLVNNKYHSELEGGGNTTYDSYMELMNVLDAQETHIKEQGYSPLEASIYIYRYLQENYAYDPNSDETDSVNYLTNRRLDIVANNNTLVCEGYATLYSALMRRCGIPMFRYSTTNHVRNIARIVDPKYGVDNIGVFDSTFDGSNINENGEFEESKTFKYFMVSPRDCLRLDDYVTIPTSLVVENEGISFISRDVYESHYNTNYISDGYAATMLRLMGIQVPEPFSLDSYYNLLDNLNRTSIFDEVDSSSIADAYTFVLEREHPEYDMYDILPFTSECSLAKLERDAEISSFSSDVLVNYDENLNFLDDGYSFNFPVELRQHDNSLDISDFNSVVSTDVNEDDNVDVTYDNQSTTNIYSDERELYSEVNDQFVDTSTSNDGVNYSEEDEFIPGTVIRKPRFREAYESDDDYLIYLSNYYGNYFPAASEKNMENNCTYSMRREEIIQDLPIYSKQVSRYSGIMSNEEIESSRESISVRR